MKWLPRLGLVLLLGALGAFEALFIAERSRGHEALAAERSLRSARASDLLHEELQRQFDVGEARLEALETLPLLEEDALLWVRDGVQLFPRVPGVLPAASDALVDALGRFIDGDVTALDDVDEASATLSSAVKKKGFVQTSRPNGSAVERLFRAWPWLSRQQAAALCVRAQRQAPADKELLARCQRGLASEVLKLPAVPEGELVLTEDARWLVRAQGAELRGVELDFEATLKRVSELLSRRAVLEAGDSVTPTGSGVGMRDLKLVSPRLDAAEAALTAAWWWKSALLALTALLGLAVLLLMRLAEARERATLALQRDFISTVSHELRTPLAAIRVIAETLERKARRTATKERTGESSKRSGESRSGSESVGESSKRSNDSRSGSGESSEREDESRSSSDPTGESSKRSGESRSGSESAGESSKRSNKSRSEETTGGDVQRAELDYPRRLVAAVDGLAFLVENILSFNRIEAGRFELKREPFSLTSLEPMLREDIELMPERAVVLSCEGLTEAGALDADATLLRVLVLNLLRNTWKYSPRDAPKFTVRAKREGAVVVLTFSDDGPGIPADAHERVFEPFHRRRESSNVRGSGLGLALARRIAQLHGGTLRISASSSEGTTFELRLPSR